MKNNKGISLIEVLIYIAILALLLPALVIFFIKSVSEYGKFDIRSRMTSSAVVILSEIETNIGKASVFGTTSSTLGIDESKVYFQNTSGTEFVMETVTSTIGIGSIVREVQRLRLVNLTEDYEEWMTDPDIDTQSFKIYAVRNSSSTLTGLNVGIVLRGLSLIENGFWTNDLSVSSTIYFNPTIVEN